MTQLQIKYFLAVADEKSTTRAANLLFVSQPSVSKSIAALERELGFPLFSRRGNALFLTYAGQLLYDFLTRVKEDYRGLLSTIDHYIRQAATQVRVGCPFIWNPDVFCDKVTEYFDRQVPQIQLRIDCFSPSELISLLKNKQLDIALTYNLYDFDAMGLSAAPIASSNLGLLYAKGRYGQLSSLQDLQDANFLVYDTGSRQQFETIIRLVCQGVFTPKIRGCSSYSAAVFEMARGNGVMLFGDWDLVVRSEGLGFLPLGISQPVSAVYRRDNANPQIPFFMDHVGKLLAGVSHI